MYDAVFVLVEAFNKLLRKKPDQFRSYTMRRMGQLPVPSASNASAANGSANVSASRVLDCNTSKGWVNPWEHGDKISRYLRKVCALWVRSCFRGATDEEKKGGGSCDK